MYKFILVTLIFTININGSTLMQPTSFSKELYEEIILDDNYDDSKKFIQGVTTTTKF